MIGLFLIFIFSFILLTFVILVVGKEFFHPILIGSAYWILFLLVSISFSFYFNLTFYWSGIVPVLLLLYSFLAGTFFAQPALYGNIGIKTESTEILPGNFPDIKIFRLKFLFVTYSIAGLIAVVVQLNFLHLSIHSIADIFRAASKISEIRYSGGSDMPKYGLILMGFFYCGGFLGGAYYVCTERLGNKLFSLLPVLVALILTSVNGANFFFLYTVLVWIVGFISTSIFLNRGIIRNFRKMIFKFFIVIFLCVALIPIAQTFRGGRATSGVHLSAGAISYLGSFNAFSIWWNNHEVKEATPFKYSLSGVYDIFFGGRESGLFSKSETIGYYDKKKIDTNVYTIMRILIEDFTIFGAIGILFFTGFFLTYFYEKSKQQNFMFYILFSIGLNILFWSFATNILNYNTIILSWIICYLSLIAITKKIKKING